MRRDGGEQRELDGPGDLMLRHQDSDEIETEFEDAERRMWTQLEKQQENSR
jgi:hypothetical protein